MNARIDTSSLVDRVYEYILDRIVTGAIKYGDSISIKDIAAELNVSTMPVREAVKRLEFEQVVSIKPRSSCRVKVPSRRQIIEVYALREALETFALARSGGRAPPEALERMRVVVEQMRSLGSESDPVEREKKAVALDRAFHSEICALAGNELLNEFYRQLTLRVNMTLMHEKTYHSIEREWAEMHAEVLACLPGDPARAIGLLRDHFASAREIVEKA